MFVVVIEARGFERKPIPNSEDPTDESSIRSFNYLPSSLERRPNSIAPLGLSHHHPSTAVMDIEAKFEALSNRAAQENMHLLVNFAMDPARRAEMRAEINFELGRIWRELTKPQPE